MRVTSFVQRRFVAMMVLSIFFIGISFVQLGMTRVEASSSIVAYDMVGSSSQNLISYTDTYTNAFSSPGDGFQKYQRYTGSIPYDVLDDSLSIYPADATGIIKEGNTDVFFGIVDTINSDNDGLVTATWVFDISSGGDNLALSIDMAAMGDFESSDYFTWTYSIDGGATQTAFASSTDEAGSYTYTLEGGTPVSLNDPMTLDGTILTNDLATFTTPLVGSGSQLTLTLTAIFNGGGEEVAFQNIIIGTSSEPPTPPEPELTLIHDIQGNGTSSPLSGATVTIEGIVVGDFQDSLGTHGDLDGFFVQEEDADADTDPMTSEGIFIYQGYNPSLDVAEGDLVRVTGKVSEYFDLTEISADEITVLSSGNTLPSAAIVSLPLVSLDAWEYVENMRVTVQAATGDLTVNDNYDLGRYGSFQLSSDGRVYTYSQLYMPTDVASFNAYRDAAQLRTVVIDDGRTNQNPDPTPLINGAPFSASNTVRAGYTTASVTGVLNYAYGEYHIQPTEAVTLSESSNQRTSQAPVVGGAIRVASFNLLNYFNGDGQGGGFPTSRGADSYAEFERQNAKTIAAIIGLDADIIGVMELENDYGEGLNSAAQDLVDGLNSVVNNCSNWAYVDPGVPYLGDDEIAVGFLYCTDTVSIAAGTQPAILDDSVLADLGLGNLVPLFTGLSTNRASLAVTFHDNFANSNITIVANHLKSKGSGGATGLNADTGNGAGAYNQRRRDAVTAIDAWLATYPTGTTDNDVILIGDLNSYAMEDPILDLLAYGYTNLVDDAGAYSYGFPLVLGDVPEVQGWGTLDYAMANPSAALQVSDATEWHINSDEPAVIDYNLEYKYDLVEELYNPDAYRASDHDPAVVGLNLNHPPKAEFVSVYPKPFLEGEPVSFGFINIVDEGGTLTFDIDCTNDGSFDETSNSPSLTCIYPDAGSYTVRGRITDSFGDYSEYTMSFDVLTTMDGISELRGMVNNYEDNGLLNKGQANALNKKLDSVIRLLEHSNLDAALGPMHGILNQTQNLVDDGGALYYFAQRIMIAIVVNYG